MCNCIEIKSKKLKEKFGYRTVIFDMDILSNRIAVGFSGIDKNGKVFDEKMIVSYCPFCGEEYKKPN